MKQEIKKERITKVEFFELGGFDNPNLFRLQSRGGAWRYYRKLATAEDIAEVAANRLPGESMFAAFERVRG